MNKFQKAKLEERLSKMMGKEVELVKPTVVAMHQGEQSVDMRLLELENKQKQLIVNAGPTMKERRENRNAFTRIGKRLSVIGDKSVELVESLDTLPEKLAQLKVVDMTLDYFFPERKEEVVVFNGHYDHSKQDTVKEGNVTYLSNDFKELN